MHILFVTPPLNGPATGGTLYNKQLLAALAEAQPQDLTFEQLTLEALQSAGKVSRTGSAPATIPPRAEAREGEESSAESAPAITPLRAESRESVVRGTGSAPCGEACAVSGTDKASPREESGAESDTDSVPALTRVRAESREGVVRGMGSAPCGEARSSVVSGIGKASPCEEAGSGSDAASAPAVTPLRAEARVSVVSGADKALPREESGAESDTDSVPAVTPPRREARASVVSGHDSESPRGEARSSVVSGMGRAPCGEAGVVSGIEKASPCEEADPGSDADSPPAVTPLRAEARVGVVSGIDIALPQLGADGAATEVAACLGVNVRSGLEQVWVDSLYLSAVPELRARLDRETQLGLILHYLPSLLGAPMLRTAAELSEIELRALEAADLILTPSEYLQQLVAEICLGKPCVCVKPGVQVTHSAGASVRNGSALMICNVTENKGVLPFLQALAQVVQPTATFELAIAGDLQLEAAYARDCLALCEQHPWLRDHVKLLGSVAQSELFARLAQTSVLVSASRMESYGMALAEARALGTPILALPGGNIAYHVAAESGGQLAHSPRELAQALCALMADPAELASRLTRARATANVRPWSAAAADFVALAVQARER